MVQRLRRQRRLVLRDRHGHISAPRRTRCGLFRGDGGRPTALLLWLAKGAGRTQRNVRGTDAYRSAGTAPSHPCDPRGRWLGDRLRSHILGPDRRHPGSPTDIVDRHSRDHGRNPLRPVRFLGRMGQSSRRAHRGPRPGGPRHKGPLLGPAQRRRTGKRRGTPRSARDRVHVGAFVLGGSRQPRHLLRRTGR